MTAFMRWLRRLWSGPREWLLFLKPIRFVVIPLALLLYALIWSDQGQDAVRALVEFERNCPRWGLVSGFVLTVIFLALQSWYWARQLLRVDYPQLQELGERHERLELWTPRILGALAFLIAIAALVRALFRYGPDAGRVRTNILVTVAILAVLLILFLIFVVKRRRNQPPRRVNRESPFGAVTKWILRVTLLIALAFLVWTAISPVTAGLVFPSPPLLMFSAALWVAIGSWLVFWIDRYRVPLIGTLLLLAIVFSLWMDNHAVRTLPAPSFARHNVAATFNDWYARLHAKYPGEGRHPVFIVATEGGGIRAAYWTAAVLTALQDRAPAFADHTFAISSVSGGSVGTAVFTALVADKNRQQAVDDCDEMRDAATRAKLRFAAQQILSYDALAPTLASMLHADLAQRFLPVAFIPDRQRALEHGWERGWRTHVVPRDDFLGSGVLQMYAANTDRLMPSIFLNGTSVERGSRLIASNCLIDKNEIQDARDLFNELGADMPLSTAAGNSARFTYVSPAGSVHVMGGDIAEHVVDGGYFENSGAQTAADVVRTLFANADGKGFEVVLIIIHFTETPPPGVPPESFMNEVFSPLRALLSTRGARGELAVQEAVRLHSTDVPFEVLHFILAQEKDGLVLPLGWLLARRTRAAIDLQIGDTVPPEVPPPLVPFVRLNVDNVNAVATMLQQRAAPPPDMVQQHARETERSFLGQDGVKR
jgi:hypothetical protein